MPPIEERVKGRCRKKKIILKRKVSDNRGEKNDRARCTSRK